jgi:DNA-binding IclR family transcriptional regulator
MRGVTTTADSVQAVVRTVRLLDELAATGAHGATLAELARASALREPTAMRYLATLTRSGLAERDATTGRYRLGLRVLVLAERALGDIDPRPIVLPYMEQLRRTYGETVNLAAFREDRIILIEVLEGFGSIRIGAKVGEEDLLHSTALGKAILSRLPRERALALLASRGLSRQTSRSITTMEAIERELEKVRRRGYAIDDEESVEGLRCVGVAILDRRRHPAYGLSISAPATSLSRANVPTVGALLAAVSAKVSQRLGYSDQSEGGPPDG